jgi:hypothetical protein
MKTLAILFQKCYNVLMYKGKILIALFQHFFPLFYHGGGCRHRTASDKGMGGSAPQLPLFLSPPYCRKNKALGQV